MFSLKFNKSYTHMQKEEANDLKKVSWEGSGHIFKKKGQQNVHIWCGNVGDMSPPHTSHIFKPLLKYVNNEIWKVTIVTFIKTHCIIKKRNNHYMIHYITNNNLEWAPLLYGLCGFVPEAYGCKVSIAWRNTCPKFNI